MATEQTNLRLDTAIKAMAIAAAGAQDIPLARLVERALVAYLAGDSAVVAPGSSSDSTALSDLIARVERIERADSRADSKPDSGVVAPAPKHPRQDRQQGALEAAQVLGHPPESHPRADGGRWLSTTQAVELSSSRGGPGSVATLRRWGEDGRIAAIGLRYCPHGSKNNSLASFEDLRYPPAPMGA